MHHRPHAADEADALAEIHLRMPRRMRQRHECLAQSQPCRPDIILHHRIAAGIAMLVAQALEDPLRRMTLLYRRIPIRRQDRVDHRDQRAKLRLRRRLLAPVPRRHREPTDLCDRLPVQTKYPCRLPPAPPLDKYKLPNRRIMPPLRGLLFHRRVQSAGTRFPNPKPSSSLPLKLPSRCSWKRARSSLPSMLCCA